MTITRAAFAGSSATTAPGPAGEPVERDLLRLRVERRAQVVALLALALRAVRSAVSRSCSRPSSSSL